MHSEKYRNDVIAAYNIINAAHHDMENNLRMACEIYKNSMKSSEDDAAFEAAYNEIYRIYVEAYESYDKIYKACKKARKAARKKKRGK